MQIRANNAYNPNIPELFDPMQMLRRSYKLEISEIDKVLKASILSDDLSGLIRNWHIEFSKALELKNIDLKLVFTKFIDQLQELLVHPLTNIPLDEESVLGNDKQVYGYKFLCVHRAKTKAPYHERSPLKPLDATLFAAEPHTIVRFLIPWLKKYRPDFSSKMIENEFSQLQVVPVIPGLQSPEAKPEKPPETRIEKIQRIQREQLLRQKEKDERNQAVKPIYALADEMIDGMAAQYLDPLNRHIAERHAAANGRLDINEQNFNVKVAAINERQNQMEARGEIIDNELKMLNDELKEIGATVESAKADNVRLQIAIKETEKKINDRDKGWFKDLLKIGLVIAASWLCSIAASAILEAMGSAWTATTAANGFLKTTLSAPPGY